MMEKDVASVTFDVPAMYADHHVTEVRRILLAVPGVEELNASSAFRVVQIEYDSDKTSEEILKQILGESNYLGDLQVPMESGKPAAGPDGDTYFRHTAAYKCAGTAVSFGQEATASGKPLWPCPGMGAPKTMDEEGEPDHG